jgi:U32 family peptidase
MNIIAGISGMHTQEEVAECVEAGVDEFFIGYIDPEWYNLYGWEVSGNRRETPNCQYTSLRELENIVEIIHSFDKKVLLTLNAHEYTAKQAKLMASIIKKISRIPIDAYIIGNIGLMLHLRNQGCQVKFNLSIGSGCNNTESILFYKENIPDIDRVILPRKLTMEEIKEIASEMKKHSVKLEAFGAGESCRFSDEYCFGWHSGIGGSFCNSILNRDKMTNPIVVGPAWKSEIQKDTLGDYLVKENEIYKMTKKAQFDYFNNKQKEAETYGRDKENLIKNMVSHECLRRCGLCAVQKFKEYGIDAVKIALRGLTNNSLEEKLSAVKLFRQAIDNNADTDYCKKLIGSSLFCSGENCYYNYPMEAGA